MTLLIVSAYWAALCGWYEVERRRLLKSAREADQCAAQATALWKDAMSINAALRQANAEKDAAIKALTTCDESEMRWADFVMMPADRWADRPYFRVH